MKKVLFTKVVLLALILGGWTKALAQPNSADPAITSMSFATDPVQEGGTTTLTVFFINNGFGANSTIPAGKVGINISLPTSIEYIAFPENASNVTGTIANKFTWSYDISTRNFFGITNQSLPAGNSGTIVITVKGNIATMTPRISNANIQRIDPSFYPNENTLNNILNASLAVAPGGVVSVGLLDFNATAKDNRTVTTDWQTSSELNTKNFEVEFSTDGLKFSTIGTVTAAGNSSTPRSYNFIHTKPINGINYYRLKQFDLDGSFKYSVIRKVKFGSASLIYAMPNPTHDRVTIISGAGGKVESVGIYTADGRKMQQINNYTYGSNIDMSRFAPATYMIRITDKDGATEILKVVKN